MAEKNDDWFDNPTILRIVLFTALGLGAGNGVVIATGTDDRYRGTDAAKDFAIRDVKLSSVKHKVEELEEELKDAEKRIRALERHAHGDVK